MLLAGAALLAAMALWAVPWNRGLVRPRTLLDASNSRLLVPAYEIVTRAAAVIPPGASFALRYEPPDAVLQNLAQRLGVAFLPGRRSRPDAVLGLAAGAAWPDETDYLILVGPSPTDAPGALVLETPTGTVWRRKP